MNVYEKLNMLLKESSTEVCNESDTISKVATIKNSLADAVYEEMDTSVIKEVLNDVKSYCDELASELLSEGEDFKYIFEYYSTEEEAKEVAEALEKEGKKTEITQEGAEYAVWVYPQLSEGEEDLYKFLTEQEEFKIETLKKKIEQLEKQQEVTASSVSDVRELESLKEELAKLESKDELTEAANPDNAEANELIRSSLDNALVAYQNRDKLKDLGITVDYKTWGKLEGEPTNSNDFSKCELIGKNGRRLRCNTYNSFGLKGRDLKNVSEVFGEPSREDEHKDTLSPKSYKTSKEEVASAKEEMPTLKRRLNLYERRYGKDSQQYRELVDYIKDKQYILDRGVQARQNTYANVNKDVDFKNYLDSKRMEDRPKPYVAPKENPTVARYKDAKWQEKYNQQMEEQNKKYDEEDAQRVADVARRAAEEKSRRDYYLSKSKEDVKNTLDDIHSRIEAMKQRINGGTK